MVLDDDDAFLKQEVTYGIIVFGTLSQIQHFKELVLAEGFKVVFQKTSLGKLHIIEGKNHESD